MPDPDNNGTSGGTSGGSEVPSPPEQSPPSSDAGPAASKKVLDWSAFWSTTNVPVVGYDELNNALVILKGADHSVDSSKDILVYDFTTGTWTKGDTKFTSPGGASNDITNMISAPGSGELIAMHSRGDTTGAQVLKKFVVHQSANISSATVNITTPFIDFGSSAHKKRLYKVKVLCHGTALDKLAIQAAYDGGSYGNIFGGTPEAFEVTSAGVWTSQSFTVAAPTDFVNVSIKIYATTAMTTADWGISEIAFIYREKGYR